METLDGTNNRVQRGLERAEEQLIFDARLSLCPFHITSLQFSHLPIEPSLSQALWASATTATHIETDRYSRVKLTSL